MYSLKQTNKDIIERLLIKESFLNKKSIFIRQYKLMVVIIYHSFLNKNKESNYNNNNINNNNNNNNSNNNRILINHSKSKW
jgi:uncharacterized membrane protein